MGTTYRQATEVLPMVYDVMEAHHPELKAAEVTVGVLFADKVDKDGDRLPAIVVRGQRVLAKIKISSLEDRNRGLEDVKLIVDGEFWGNAPKSKKEAILDHELMHLTLKKDADGEMVRDDIGRPALKMRHHDWELTGFEEVMRRHGEASVEAGQFQNFRAAYGQLNLFGPEVMGADLVGKAKR